MGDLMRVSDKQVCEELLCDLICYEMRCNRLSPEMKYLLEMHVEQCPNCRKRIMAFFQMVDHSTLVRNFG